MFAGCIEKKSDRRGVGSRLLTQMRDGGLALFPSQVKSSWSGDFADDYCVTIIEQSIHANDYCAVEVIEDVLVSGWLRIDNREELFSALKLSKNTTDRQLIVAAYCQWGDRVCEYLCGDFSFVILDFQEQRCLLCRDHMGVRPLYYYQDASVVVFSTSMAAMLALESITIDFSKEYIARYCSSVASDWSLTVYEQILKLPPAHIGTFLVKDHSTRGTRQETVSTGALLDMSISAYFRFDPEERLILSSEQDYIHHYQTHLEEAVRCRVSGCGDELACESSGGIDSSTITAVSAKYVPDVENNLHAYGFVTEVQEEECIMMMSQFLNINNTTLIKDNEKDLDVIQQAASEFSGYAASPIAAQIATVHAPIYQRVKESGAEVLLSGFGGDEFVTIYGATARVELFKKHQWNKWFSLFDGGFWLKRLKAFKWMLRFYLNGNTFETAQSLLRMKRLFLKKQVIKKDVSDQYEISKIVTDRSSYDSGCESVNEFSLSNRWSPDMVSRLEDCSLAAASQGIEYRWPLLDVRLIRFFLSVPSEYKLSNGIPRYLHRKAIQGLVPEHIIWKGKSMGGTIVCKNHQLKSIEMEAFYDQHVIPFKKLHQELQSIIDREKWESTIDQLNQAFNSNHEADAIQQLLSILNPVISINEWLHGFKKG